jgi:hypothetical protein
MLSAPGMDNMAGMNARTVIENTLFMFWNLASTYASDFATFTSCPPTRAAHLRATLVLGPGQPAAGPGDEQRGEDRRTTIADEAGAEFHLLSIPDLVAAKKTQRTKDWPIIELLVAIHYHENSATPRPDWITFWLLQARTPELLQELARRFPDQAEAYVQRRPLLRLAISGEMDPLREALDAETRAEQAKDRAYWAPLKAELEASRQAERGG